MAETIISPGVFTRENDISFIQPAPVAAGAAIIGPAVKGPVEVPTLVTSYNDYVRKFGTTFSSGSTSFQKTLHKTNRNISPKKIQDRLKTKIKQKKSKSKRIQKFQNK